MKNITILISGAGSNMKAIVAACEDGLLDAKVTTVISSQKSPAFQMTKGWCDIRGIQCWQNRKDFYDFEWMYESILSSLISLSQPDLVCLAGYMFVLPEGIVSQYEGRMINIHPSILPKYPGLNTHARALENGDTFTGATVHYVIPELDAGPIINQEFVRIHLGDTAEEIQARVRAIEHRLYITTIREILHEGIDTHHKKCSNRNLENFRI